jgi:hypothetical protein
LTNPVEREDYAQKIARTLRVDARSVLARLLGTGRRDTRRQSSLPGAEELSQQQSAAADLEGYCLAALLRRPALFAQIDDWLEESQLESLQGKDFEDAGNRVIFETWQAVLAKEQPNPVEALREQMPERLYAQLDASLAFDPALLADEQLVVDVMRALLRLRKRNLQRLGKELEFLRIEAQEAGDARAAEYDQIQLAHTKRLLLTQKALSQRWG